MVENNTDSIPFFAPAGQPSAFFVVKDGLPAAEALEGASAFLSGATGIAVENTSRASESRQWAVVYLLEMAKSLVDSAAVGLMTEAMQAPGGIAGAAKGGAL